MDSSTTSGTDSSSSGLATDSTSRSGVEETFSGDGNYVDYHNHHHDSSENIGHPPLQIEDFPWLVVIGDICYSEKQIAKGIDLSNTRKKYKKMYCSYCAEFNSITPWAQVKPRKLERLNLIEHENSVHHQKALSLRNQYGQQQPQTTAGDTQNPVPNYPTDMAQLMALAYANSGGSNLLDMLGLSASGVNQFTMANVINAAAIAAANSATTQSQTTPLSFSSLPGSSNMVWSSTTGPTSTVPNAVSNSELLAAQAVAQSMLMSSINNGMNMNMNMLGNSFPMNPLFLSPAGHMGGFPLPSNMMPALANNSQGLPFQFPSSSTSSSHLNIPMMGNSSGQHHMNVMNPSPLPLRMPSTVQSLRMSTNADNDPYVQHAARKRKKLNSPPQWAESVGQLRHSESQMESGKNLKGVKRKYKMLKCKICAVHVPNSPWGTMRPRKFETSVFEEHERSSYHRKAIELQIGACSGSTTGGILG